MRHPLPSVSPHRLGTPKLQICTMEVSQRSSNLTPSLTKGGTGVWGEGQSCVQGQLESKLPAAQGWNPGLLAPPGSVHFLDVVTN